MNRQMLLLLVALLTVALGSAADVAGKWAYEQAGRGGGPPAKTTLDLKTDGSKLSGTVTVQRGGGGIGGGTPPTIRNGKTDGKRVEFEVVQEFQGNQRVTKYD